MSASDHDLTQLENDVEWNTRLTTGLVTLFIVVIGVFALLTYRRYVYMTQPEVIVATAEEAITANFPEARAALKKEIIKAAPTIADKLSQVAVANVPEAREQLVVFLDRQLDKGLDKVTEISADRFRKALQDNREMVLKGIEELKEVPEETEQFVIDLEKRLEKSLGADMEKQAYQALSFLRDFNDKLSRLAEGTGLEPEELLEQQIVRLLRTMQQNFTGQKQTAQR